jgi:hypothetical protein
MKRKLINIFIFCFVTLCCNAQIEGYKYYAELDSIKTSGFYNIVLSPEINAKLKTDYTDLRIVNASDKWIPHAVHVPAYKRSREIASFDLKYTQTENNKTNTTLIINAVSSLNNIEITIRNTAAERYCSLSGSDDSKNWFVINDSILISPVATETKSINSFEINFPLNNYKFYKLNIVNNNKDPYEINKITSSGIIVEPDIIKSKIITNPSPVIFQKDSNNISYIKISQKYPFHFDGLNFKVSGVKYYSRSVDLFIPTNTNHSFANPGKLLQSFTISNNSNLNFRLPLINESVFYLLIKNEDNLPLQVNEMGTTLNEHYIKAYLEKSNSYRLILSNEKATAPKYDISKLDLSIKDTAAFLNVKNIIAFPHQEKLIEKKESNNKWLVWIALIAGLAILLLLTKKMIKEVNKKEENDTI